MGTFGMDDPNAGDTHTYTLVSGTGDEGNPFFSIEDDALKTAAVFDCETRNSYTIRVRALDNTGLFFEKPFVVSIANLSDSAPTGIDLTIDAVDENLPEGTVVGVLSTIDPDVTDTHIYTLVSGTGDTDNGSFAIEDDALQTAEAFDFEAKQSHSIRIRSEDNTGLSVEVPFSVDVNDIDDSDSDDDDDNGGGGGNGGINCFITTMSNTE